MQRSSTHVKGHGWRKIVATNSGRRAGTRWDIEIAAVQYRRKLMSEHDLNLHHLGHSIRRKPAGHRRQPRGVPTIIFRTSGHRSANVPMKRIIMVVAGAAILTAVPTTMANALMQGQNVSEECSFLGVQVRPITAPFAASLGMAKPYGAIFDRPEPDSPAARAGIQTGDVVTAINGLPLSSWNDFATTMSKFAPGTTVYLTTWRNGQLVEAAVTLGSSKCPGNKTPPAST
jgi:hypothetical protein